MDDWHDSSWTRINKEVCSDLEEFKQRLRLVVHLVLRGVNLDSTHKTPPECVSRSAPKNVCGEENTGSNKVLILKATLAFLCSTLGGAGMPAVKTAALLMVFSSFETVVRECLAHVRRMLLMSLIADSAFAFSYSCTTFLVCL